MSVKDRLKEYLEIEEITISQFERSIGASNGYVNSINKSIGLDKINSIIEFYPNLNIDWLMTGRGNRNLNYAESLKNVTNEILNQPITGYHNENDYWRDQYIEMQRKYSHLQEEHTLLLKNKLKEYIDADKSSA